MGVDKEGDLDRLVAGLPNQAVPRLIDAMAGWQGGGSRAEEVRLRIVTGLNGRRPQKARRLFTSLFDPMLSSDAILPFAGRWMPGLLHRVDIGGLWSVLSQSAMAGLAAEVQATLSAMARDTLLDQVLQSPEATDLRRRMRVDTITHLTQVRGDESGLADFIGAIDEHKGALERARGCRPPTYRLSPIYIDFIVEYLVFYEDVDEIARQIHHDLSSRSLSMADALRQAVWLLRKRESLGRLLPEAGLLQDLPVFYVLHVRRLYGAVAECLVLAAGPAAGRVEPAAEGLYLHLEASAHAITETLEAITDDSVGGTGGIGGLVVGKDQRAMLEAGIGRLEATQAALRRAGLLKTGYYQHEIQHLLRRIGSLGENVIGPAFLEHAVRALHATEGPVADHDAVVWLSTFLWRFHQSLDRLGDGAHPVSLFGRLHDEALLAFGEVVSRDNGAETAAGKLGHLLRIDQILRAMGRGIGPWIARQNHAIKRILTEWQEKPDGLSEAEVRVVQGLVP